MKKKMIYPAVIAGLIAVTFCAYAAETMGAQPVLAAKTGAAYTTATLTFGTTVQNNAGHDLSASSFSASGASSYVTESGFATGQSVSYAVSNCQQQGADWYDDYALQIGKISNWPVGTTAGSLTITLKGCKYQSVSIYADTYYKKYYNSSTGKNMVRHYVEIPFAINGESLVSNGSWSSSGSGVSQGAVPQSDQYHCDVPLSTLTISVPGTTEQYDMIYVQKIVFHLTK